MMIIRPATSVDAADIARIHALSWQHAYSGIISESVLGGLSEEKGTPVWTERILKAESRILVAEDPGRGVVGWVCFGAARQVPDTRFGEVYAIYLDPAHLRGGIGAALMSRAESELSGQGMTSVMVWALEKNHAARLFYRKLGYREDESRQDVFAGKTLKSIRHVKKPGEPVT